MVCIATSFIHVFGHITVVMDFIDRILYNYSFEFDMLCVLEVPCMKKIPLCIFWCYHINCNLNIK